MEHYASEQRLSDVAGQALRAWQIRQENGDISTDNCPTCWAVAIIETGSDEGLAFNTCENCYRTVCEFCHQHASDDEFGSCLCGPCAGESQESARAAFQLVKS